MKTLEDLYKSTISQDPLVGEIMDSWKPRVEIANALIRLRKAAGVSQREMAGRLQTKQPAVARLESGIGSRQTTEAIVEYAEALNLHVGLVFIKKDKDGLCIEETISVSGGEDINDYLKKIQETESYCRSAERKRAFG